MKRKHFLQTSRLALGSVLIGNSVLTLNIGTRSNTLSLPDKVTTSLSGIEFSLVKSGTLLFISAQPESTGPEQKAFIKECFATASTELPVGEPLDWLENTFPKKWKLNGKVEEFNWDLD